MINYLSVSTPEKESDEELAAKIITFDFFFLE